MNKSGSGFSREDLVEFRALQEEMRRLSQDYSEARLEAWSREMRGMTEGWQSFQEDWQGTLSQMSGAAMSAFEGITAHGGAASARLARSWQDSLTQMAGEVGAFGDQVKVVLDMVGQGAPSRSSGGGGSDWFSWLDFDFGFGGLFHQGGIVEAHRGMVVNPETLFDDERPVKVQTGEGVLPREAMLRLGEENFEALRSGRLEMGAGGGPPSTISPSRCRAWTRPVWRAWTGTAW